MNTYWHRWTNLANAVRGFQRAKESIRSTSSSAISLLSESLDPGSGFLNTRAERREFSRLLQVSAADIPISYYKTVHGRILVSNFDSDIFLSNILLNVYSKSDSLEYARKLFDKMPDRNLVSWSTMVSAYTQHKLYEEAVVVFLDFRGNFDGSPSEYILASVIRACSHLGVDGGSIPIQTHAFVIKTGFGEDLYVGTSLIDFYAKINDIDGARRVFDALPVKSTVTWTTLLSGCVKSGKSHVSLELFNQMRQTDIVPDRYVLSSVLSACTMLGYVEGGKQIHCHVLRRGTEMDVSVGNVLIDLYMKCGKARTARILFDRMEFRNVISWTTMIAGYMQNSLHSDAMKFFLDMSRFGIRPDMFACTSVVTSCGSLQSVGQGRQVHAYTIKANLETDSYVRNGLIDMYAKCQSLADARKVFDIATEYNVVTYNAMIEGYSSQEMLSEALDLFHVMRLKMVQPSLLTFVSLLGVSASSCTLELSKQFHGLMFKHGFCLEIFAGSALVDVYSKCSCIKDARFVFEEMNEKDIVVWNSMFSGYVQQLENEEALKLYSDLQLSTERADEFTFAALVTAASNIASWQLGRELHCQLNKMGLESNSYVTNALVDMYAKSGSFDEAQKAFNLASFRDVVCWNSIISSYANHGDAKKALRMFERMMDEGIQPNYITFVGVLSACSHAGLVEEGLNQFESMSRLGIEPGTEHYACIVSLLGRAGKILEARNFIDEMPIKPAAIVWRSLLSACTVVGNVEMAKHAAEMAITSDPTDSGSFVLLSNIYASKNMWGDVKLVRERMEFDGVVKEPGRSWIEVNSEVHAFLSKDKAHSKANEIYNVLEDLIVKIKGTGYVLDASMLWMSG